MHRALRLEACWLIAAAATAWPQAASQSSDKPAKPSTAVVEGKVVSQVNGSPLKKTTLTLRPNGMGRNVATETDDEGHFSFPKVDPGMYWLIGERTGYAQQYFHGTSGTSYGAMIPLQAGDEVKDLVFKLIPNALISGRVLDEDGDPMARAQVTALHYMYRTSGKQLQGAGSATTGANGEYSMSVPPGRYMLMAMSTTAIMQGMTAQTAKPPNDAPEFAYSATYYPNSSDEVGAASFEAAAGADLRGMDFHMAKVKTFRVRGRVPESTSANVMLQLVPKGGSTTSSSAPRITRVQADKTFEFVGVVPGTYSVIANSPDGISIAGQAVTVDDRHINGLSLALVPMGALTGTVTIEGDDTISRNGILVGFDAFENGSNPSAGVGEDGKFTIRYILPDRYHPWVGYPPKNAYAKSIRYDGQDIKDGALDLTAGITGPVEIVLSLTGVDLTGVVTDEDGKPFPGATVVLVPNSDNYLMHYSMNTDYKGQFHMPAVRPGEYKALAFEDVIYLAWFDKEFLKPYMSKAVTLSVSESEKKALSLKVIPATATRR